MELEFARELRRRLLANCEIGDWDEDKSIILDDGTDIPGLEASGCKLLFSYKGITFKENVCLQRIIQDIDINHKVVEWQGGDYLALYTTPESK
ncbi:hypothetical protein E2P65_01470 [Candidatus Bathyarchaeota archaeon]|nr:hypothetical protein E2P65_01470 [Candidatus Bathyarchaeota archaeon]